MSYPPELDDWTTTLAQRLGLAGEVPTQALLDMTRDAAHTVVRPAGPITTYLLGVAVGQGANPEEAQRIITDSIARWPEPGVEA